MELRGRGQAREGDRVSRRLIRPRRSLERSANLLWAFRLERRDPDRFYDALAADAVASLGSSVPLAGARVLDIGGGAGYLTRALRASGARCVLVDRDVGELSWRGPPPQGSAVADAVALPFADGAVDLVVCSNALEHMARPRASIDEMARVLRGGGHLWVSFTCWFGPWGGHETSPWHYLGGTRARRLYEARYGRPPKNVYGESLFRLGVGETIRWFAHHPGLEVLYTRPRYLPDVANAVVRVPVVRELLTWNLEILATRRNDGETPDPAWRPGARSL